MGLAIKSPAIVVQPANQGVPAFRQLRQGGILNIEISLAHRTAHMNDRMAGHAAQTALAFRRVLDFAYRMLLHRAVANERVIVAAVAPERRLDADSVLHVFD